MNNKGFTLIELMIVVTIIGILAAAVIRGGGQPLYSILAVIGTLFVIGTIRIATEELLEKFENTPQTTVVTIEKEN